MMSSWCGFNPEVPKGGHSVVRKQVVTSMDFVYVVSVELGKKENKHKADKDSDTRK